MNNRIAVVPGSFDPPTLGHLDVIRRAAALYDELHVLVVHNPDKEAMLPIAQRLSLLEQSIAEQGVEAVPVLAQQGEHGGQVRNVECLGGAREHV